MQNESIDQLYARGVQTQRDNPLEAERIFRDVLAKFPLHVGALHSLGLMVFRAGRSAEALQLLGQAVAMRPQIPWVYLNYGNVLRSVGKIPQAIQMYREAIAIDPAFSEGLGNLANLLATQNQFDEAASLLRKAIQLKADAHGLYYNLGVIYVLARSWPAAIETLEKAISLNPTSFEAYPHLSSAYRESGRAAEADAVLRNASHLKMKLCEDFTRQGVELMESCQTEDAIAAFQKAMAINPSEPAAPLNFAGLLLTLGDLDGALKYFRHGIYNCQYPAKAIDWIEFNPDPAQDRAAQLAHYHQAQIIQQSYAQGHSNLAGTMLYHPATDMPAFARELQAWDQLHVQPFRSVLKPHDNDRSPGRRLRIGYVSSDFRNHPSASFLLPLLSNHDKSQVEIFAYAQIRNPDDLTEHFKTLVDHWRDTINVSDDDVCSLIRKDQIDILVDLKLHTPDHRLLLFARKPAPVQVSWLGYPGPVGISTIDYRFTDPYLEPPDAEHAGFPDKPLRLPDTFWCYEPLLDLRPSIALPAQRSEHITFGCLNNPCKVNESVLKLWSRVLRELPTSRLILMSPPGAHRDKTTRILNANGVDSRRIELVSEFPYEEYLRRYARIDIGLDTLPYNGHTTTLDAMCMGVPVVTRVGRTIVGRAGFAQLSNLGLSELAGHSDDEFVKIAVDLANDLPRLTELRRTLRDRMQKSPLMDGKRFAAGVESAYRTIWRKWVTAG